MTTINQKEDADADADDDVDADADNNSYSYILFIRAENPPYLVLYMSKKKVIHVKHYPYTVCIKKGALLSAMLLYMYIQSYNNKCILLTTCDYLILHIYLNR